MYEKLVSYNLYSFCVKYVFMPAAQFAYRKGLGCTDALPTKSHHLQKSIDIGIGSYIVQLDFSAAFDRMNDSGHLFKLMYIGVGGSVLSICREFCPFVGRQRVVVVGATSEWIPIVSGMPQECVLDPILFIHYISEILFACNNVMTPHYWQLFATQLRLLTSLKYTPSLSKIDQ